MRIRVATDADGPALVAVDVATWSPAVTPAPTPDLAQAFFDARTVPDWVLVAEGDAGIAGYLALRPATHLATNAHVMEVRGLAVLPKHQGQGLARRLLAAAAEHARGRGIRRLRLRVMGTNPRAIALYLASGYRLEGVLRNEFHVAGRDVDDIFLALDLDAPG